jgi:hypothetical protein
MVENRSTAIRVNSDEIAERAAVLKNHGVSVDASSLAETAVGFGNGQRPPTAERPGKK